MIKNWKYDNWKVEVKESPYKTNCDLSTFIDLEILPEDLEIMINILRPRLFEHQDRVFCNLYDEDDQQIKDIVNNAKSRLTKNELQASINRFNIRDIFFNNSDNSTDETINNIAKLIQHSWEYHLEKAYPDRKFVVKIDGEVFEPYVSFYQL